MQWFTRVLRNDNKPSRQRRTPDACPTTFAATLSRLRPVPWFLIDVLTRAAAKTLHIELQLMQLRIHARAGNQLRVCTRLDDGTILHDDYQISMLDG